MADRLTKHQKVLLRLAIDLGGTINVFPDQRSDVSALENRGYMVGNGKHLDRQSTITPAGRRALQSGGDE